MRRALLRSLHPAINSLLLRSKGFPVVQVSLVPFTLNWFFLKFLGVAFATYLKRLTERSASTSCQQRRLNIDLNSLLSLRFRPSAKHLQMNSENSSLVRVVRMTR
jgi:hypothetical protein